MSRLVLLFLAYILVAAAFPEYEGLNTTCTKSHDCQVINTAAVGICKDGKCDYELTRGFIYFPFKEVKKNVFTITLPSCNMKPQQSKMRKLTSGILGAKKWLIHEKQRHDHEADDLNTRRVFDISIDEAIPPPKQNILSDYEDRRNFTKECEKYRDHWAERTYRHAFSNFSKQYSLSFYWSALTLVTLGEQPSPQRSFQNIFEIIVTLLGLVIFAVIVGDVGNMVQTMNLKRTDYEEIFDGTRAYMLRHQVPQQLQQKIIRYLTYIWGQGQIGVDEKAISDFLPNRLYGHMAVHIHMETLRRVPLFADCDPTLLYEFILRLELQVYSPGDYICRKGEVGKEMYIVKSGFVEVVNEDGTKIFVRLGEGVVFGELSILNIPGNRNGDRRTANVRSAGYTNLYALRKEDLWEALRDYPQATQSLFEKGRQILAKDNLLEETTEEHDNWDPDAPIEEKFETIRRDMEEFTKQLDEAEVMLRASMDREKQLVTKLEESFVEFFELVNRDDEHEEDSDSDG
ncbi:unnamed protein product, partial [Mesorhabditis spiculigera]